MCWFQYASPAFYNGHNIDGLSGTRRYMSVDNSENRQADTAPGFYSKPVATKTYSVDETVDAVVIGTGAGGQMQKGGKRLG